MGVIITNLCRYFYLFANRADLPLLVFRIQIIGAIWMLRKAMTEFLVTGRIYKLGESYSSDLYNHLLGPTDTLSLIINTFYAVPAWCPCNP